MSGYEKSPDYGGVPPTPQQWLKAALVIVGVIVVFVVLAVAQPR